MSKGTGRSLVGPALAAVLLASGCGTAVSSRQAAREAGEDARRAGLSVRAVGDGVGSDGLTDGGLVDPVTGDTTPGAGAAGGGASAAGGASTGTPAATPQTGPSSKCTPAGATDTGVTATEISIGWVGTLTGPVPGLFRGALIGTQAFAALTNSRGGICGRRLKVKAADDALDSGKNRTAHLQLKDQVYAFVGSFSVSDDGGASVLADCKCPDVGGALSRARVALPNSYSPQPSPDGWRSGEANYYKQKYGLPVIQKTAFFVSAIQSAREIAANERKVLEGIGYKIVYTREVQANETNFTGDVIQMQNNGVQTLIYQGDVGNMGRMAKAIHDQGYKLTLANWGGAMYDDNAFNIAGKEALEGAVIGNVYGMFRGEDAARIPEIATFDQWMKRIDPNQPVDLFAWYGWMSAKLFVKALTPLGAAPTRPKLLASLAGIGTWDADGSISPVNVGQRKPADCFMLTRIINGKYVREFPTDKSFSCEYGGFVYTKA